MDNVSSHTDTDAVSTAFELPDHPTPEFRQHHNTISRGGTTGGQRVRTRLERLLVAEDIKPEEADGGRRFGWSYEVGSGTGIGSCLRAMGLPRASGGAAAGADLRRQAFQAYSEARDMLNGGVNPNEVRGAPSNMLVRFCVEDASFQEIGQELGMAAKTVKRRVCRYLALLATHYAAADRRRGRDVTPATKAAALARFDPDRLH